MKAFTKDGRITECKATEENIGKGRCNHVFHDCDYFNQESFQRAVSAVKCYGNNKAKINPAISMEHNYDAYNAIKESFSKEQACCINHATGTGKSSIALSVIDDYYDEKCVVVCPRNGIIEELKKYNKGNRSESNVEYITIEDIEKNIESCQEKYDYLKDDVRLFVLDELHRYSGEEKWSSSLAKFMELCNKDENSKILGMTATMERGDGKNAAETFCNGNVVHEFTLKDAIQSGVLPEPTYIACKKYDESDFKNIIAGSNDKDLKKFVNAKNKEYGFNNAHNNHIRKLFKENFDKKLEHDSKNNQGTKILVTLENTKDKSGEDFVRSLKDMYPDKNIVWSEYHSGLKGEDKKNAKNFIEKFTDKNRKVDKDTIEVCCAVDMFNEGIHAPGLETIVMGRKTKSNTIVEQQYGRVLSLASDNPIIFDFSSNHSNTDTGLASILPKNKVHIDTKYEDDVREAKAYKQFRESVGANKDSVKSIKAGMYRGRYRTFDEILSINGFKNSHEFIENEIIRSYGHNGISYEKSIDNTLTIYKDKKNDLDSRKKIKINKKQTAKNTNLTTFNFREHAREEVKKAFLNAPDNMKTKIMLDEAEFYKNNVLNSNKNEDIEFKNVVFRNK